MAEIAAIHVVGLPHMWRVSIRRTDGFVVIGEARVLEVAAERACRYMDDQKAWTGRGILWMMENCD